MAPGPKRKRPDRPYSQDDHNTPRQSPHRPQQLSLAHPYPQNNNPRGGGNGGNYGGGGNGGGGQRRQSRNGGRGGSSVPQSPNMSQPSPTARSPPTNNFNNPQHNRPAPPAPPTPIPPREPPLTPSREVPESNEYLTPERVAKWNAEARQAVVQAAVSAQGAGDGLTLAVVFHEIIEAAIDSLMPSNELGSMVRDIVAAPSDDLIDSVSIFLDTLSSLTHDEKSHVLVRHMLVATDIDVGRMRSELDNDLLKSLSLVRDSFPKMAVRKATHALYRQSNYNLLREETEGYSKLMTEYFTTVNNEPPSHDVVSETYERVNALIGAFDLDIGRVLDVTLDVFANLLVKHGKFFVKFLRSSAWWPEQRGLEGIEWQEPDVSTLPSWAEPGSALWYHSDLEKEEQLQLRERRDRKFWQRVGELEALGGSRGIEAFFELGARRITANNRPTDPAIHAEGAQLSKQQAARKWADDWMSETGTLPPFGNDIAAQLLGFKLRFYASDTRDASDFLPDNLIYLAALLIKVGFISILDLYPHLYPPEQDMAAHRRKLLKEKKDREAKESGRVGNALAMASALPDEMPSGPPAMNRLRDAESKASLKADSERSTPAKSDDATDAKPALPEPADQKFQLLKSLLCIGALPEAFFILGRHPWLLEVYPDLRDCLFRLAHHSLSKVYEAARPVPSEEISVVSKGANSRAPSRPSDFIPRRTLRWAKPDQRDAGDGIDYRFYWEDWVDNVPVCHEVDDVIKLCTTLLALIGPECGKDIVLLTKLARIARKDLADNPSDANRKRWIDFSATFLAPALSFTGQNPGIVNEVWELLKQFDTATRYTIYESWFEFRNAKPAMRTMFDTMRKETNALLNKVTAINTKEYGRKIAKLSYSNPGLVFRNTVTRLIGYPNMIDALVECSKYLTLLGYDCLTWTLVSTLTNPSKEGKKEDGMFAQTWLTNLSLFIGKAYQKYHLMDPTPVLQYTTHQLLQPDGELYMLDVLEQMIKWMGGIGLVGSLSESMVFSLCGGPVLRTFTLQHHLSDTRHLSGTSARRLAKCLKDRGLAPQILVALAQHVEAFIHREDQLDTPDKVVFFNSDKLRSNLFQYLEFLRAYVSVEEFDEAFPSLVEMIAEFNVDPAIAFTVCRASIAAKANAYRIEKQNSLSGNENPSANGDVAMEEADEAADAPESTSTEVALSDAPNVEITKVVDGLKAVLPSTFTDHPCLSFYVTFWQLSLPDVDNDGIKQRYRETINHFERQLVPVVVTDRRGYSNPNIPRKETSEMRRAREEISKLKKEQQAFEKTTNLTQDHLRIEMTRWFDNVPMLDSKSDALHNALLQDCFIPRSRMSLQDAQYASSMLRFMHSSGVPGFRTIKLLDNLFGTNRLTCIVSMYSEEESKSFGRFLNDVLRELQKWHDNKDDAYAKSAHGLKKNLPGFGRRFDADRNPTELLSYDDFCKLLYKWHKALFVALKTCIESGKFTEIRNSISILNAISASFPKVDTMSEELRIPLENIAKNDERDDLKILAQSTFKVFKKGKSFWLTEWDFRNIPAPPEAVNGANKAASEKAQTPQPRDIPTKLNVNAPVFKSKADPNGMQIDNAAKTDDDAQSRSHSSPATPALRPGDKDLTKQGSRASDVRASTPSQQDKANSTSSRNTPVPSGHTSVPPRPDNRNTPTQSLQQGGRPSHNLPIRPDSQPPRARQDGRPGSDRQSDYGSHGRHDSRPPPNDYGRLERPNDPVRDRERPVHGGRTPERMPGPVDRREWQNREQWEYDERAMRGPPRDSRLPPVRPPPTWDPRDGRDGRDHRERVDPRGHALPPPMEPRRVPSNSALGQDHPPYRRDMPPGGGYQNAERNENAPFRPPPAVISANDVPINPTRGALINPARAALIIDAEGRPEPSRPDRDNRRERGPQPQSPRRVEDRRPDERRGDDRRVEDRPPNMHHGRGEGPREHRDERVPPHAYPSSRDHVEDPVGSTPTGPRGGRNDAASSARISREMFQPSQSSRSSGNPVQDPNYGRLNQPSEPIPSGPRNDRRDQQLQHQPSTAPSGPPGSNPAGIHPSRLENFGNNRSGPPTPANNMSNAPSGPRGSGRTPQGPPPMPMNRGPPTGPAMNDRGPRNSDNRHPLRTINSVLTQNAPTPDRLTDQSASAQSPITVRGRGANRANGPMDRQGDMAGPMPPPSHTSTPSMRNESQHSRSDRTGLPPNRPETEFQEERSESHSRRESRRGERSGHDRSHSSSRSDKRPDERSSRTHTGPPTERVGQLDEQERGGGDRERGREKRGSERESSRHHRERGSERSHRDTERSSHESRESKRERGSRDEGRTSGRDERDRRSRGGGNGGGGSSGGAAAAAAAAASAGGGGGGMSGDDGRKRVRDPTDQAHGDVKRRR